MAAHDLSRAAWRESSRSTSNGACVEVALNLVGAQWRKSRRSAQNGSCVEVALNLAGAGWRKSTRSQQNGACVEEAGNLDGVVGVRDGKDLAGPALAVHPAAFEAFTAALKSHPSA